MRKKEKNPYPRHLTRRIVIGVAITLLFMQLLVMIGNAFIFLLASTYHAVNMSNGLLYVIEEALDYDTLEESAVREEKTAEYLKQEKAISDLMTAFSETITDFGILYGNPAGGYYYLMSLASDDPEPDFMLPAEDVTQKDVDSLLAAIRKNDEDKPDETFMMSPSDSFYSAFASDSIAGTPVAAVLSGPEADNIMILLVNVSYMSVLDETRFAVPMIAAALLVIAVLFIIILSIRLNKRTASPLKKLSRSVRDFVNLTKTDKTPDQWVYVAPPIKSKDEIQALADSIRDMTTDMKNAVSGLVSASQDKARMATELDLAFRIQSSSLPSVFPPFPDHKEFEIFASMDPAKEVGGDFYDFFLIDEKHLGLVIADVSGKGIPAALFMMSTKNMISSLAKEGYSPAALLEKANTDILLNNAQDMFITVWYGVLDLNTGIVRAANAGHEYPAICRSGGRFELFKDKHGFVIGELEGMKYKEYEFRMNPGDTLFVYTDGVPEAQSPDAQFFGTDRMLQALNEKPGSDPETIIKTVNAAFYAYMNGAPQFDDATMLCVRLLSLPEAPTDPDSSTPEK